MFSNFAATGDDAAAADAFFFDFFEALFSGVARLDVVCAADIGVVGVGIVVDVLSTSSRPAKSQSRVAALRNKNI